MKTFELRTASCLMVGMLLASCDFSNQPAVEDGTDLGEPSSALSVSDESRETSEGSDSGKDAISAVDIPTVHTGAGNLPMTTGQPDSTQDPTEGNGNTPAVSDTEPTPVVSQAVESAVVDSSVVTDLTNELPAGDVYDIDASEDSSQPTADAAGEADLPSSDLSDDSVASSSTSNLTSLDLPSEINSQTPVSVDDSGTAVVDLLQRPETELLLDGSSLKYSRLLVTGSSANSSSFWMCTFSNDGKFVERSALRFNLDGSGVYLGQPISWSEVEEAVLVRSETDELILNEILFEQRLQPSDMLFAKVSSGSRLACDWSGLPRSGELLNDPVENERAKYETLFLDTAIVTGTDPSDDQMFWECESNLNGVSEDFQFSFFSSGEYSGRSTGRWKMVAEDQLALSSNDSLSIFLAEISFGYDPLLGYNSFSSNHSQLGEISCVLSGRQRVMPINEKVRFK